MSNQTRIGLGGGCHWCTEAVFQSLKGVLRVEQGFISSFDKNSSFSEAVMVNFDSNTIDLKDLIEIHLHTHKSTSNHSFRKKYRSAIYYFETNQREEIQKHLNLLQLDFEGKIITQNLEFNKFESSRTELLNYYQNNPEKPFCKRYIHPKLELLKNKYAKIFDL